MEPITINAQLSFKEYYNVNLYMLFKRRIIWIMLSLAVIFFLFAIFVNTGDDKSLNYLAGFYLIYVLLMPGIMYLSAKRLYKKVPAMSEAKLFEFTPDHLKITGETVKMETAWSNINKAVKRKEDYIIFTTSSKSFFNFPRSAFQSDQDVSSFEQLIKDKVKKNNF